ncbi:MAG TPA: hypothetical protein VII69_09960 [Candidatus Eremiobacteraceae bacterium]
MTIVAALISALFLASTPAPTVAAPAGSLTPAVEPSPVVIYHRAIAAMRSANAHRPDYATYQLDYIGHNLVLTPKVTKGKTDWDMDLKHANDSHSYQVWYRSHDERALTQDLATHAAYRGEALIAPTEADVLENGSTPKPSVGPSPTPSGPPDSPAGATTEVLGSVSVEASRYYDITLVGVENLKGSEVYHLHLHANSDVIDHPLTDLYVDTTTYLVRAAHAEVTLRGVVFAFGLAIDVAYEPVGAYWLLDNLHFHGNGYALFYHANMECTMIMHDFTVPASLPESYFTVPATP